ncbi:ATP-binding protein [Streptomyces sp. NPDC058434]|uniref:ATP-binding protein n=1 Tax=Streptomyces sp. NPDC058434 TaxID=3346498 RepID=UPI003665334F
MAVKPLPGDEDLPGLWEEPTAHAVLDGGAETPAIARMVTGSFLAALSSRRPPAVPQRLDDILLVVSELAANAVRHAPGRITLMLRPALASVHITVRDTSRTAPLPLPPDRLAGGGVGWHLIRTLAEQVSVLPDVDGKEIHVFMPW